MSSRASLNECGKLHPHANLIPRLSSLWRVVIQTALSRSSLEHCLKVTTNFIAKQNEFGVCVSIMHPVKIPVHKIQFCFMICLRVFEPQLSL